MEMFPGMQRERVATCLAAQGTVAAAALSLSGTLLDEDSDAELAESVFDERGDEEGQPSLTLVPEVF